MLSEKQFLISTAVRKFNEQYGKNHQLEDFDITSIDTRHRYDRSYEITSNRLDDFLRLHIHIRFEGLDKLNDYRIEVTGEENGIGNLTDEIFVSTGTIDPYYRNQGVYRFHPITDQAIVPSNVMLLENGLPLEMENGGYFLSE